MDGRTSTVSPSLRCPLHERNYLRLLVTTLSNEEAFAELYYGM